MDLLVLGEGAVTESRRVEKGAKRVASAVGTVRVFLTSVVIGLETNSGLVDVADDLNVAGCITSCVRCCLE